MRRRSGKSGIALVLVLIIITLTVIFTTAFSKSMMSGLGIIKDSEYSVLAFYVADSGIQVAIERIATGNAGSFDLTSPGSVIRLDELPQSPDLIGEVSVAVNPAVINTSPEELTIKSTGVVKRVIPGHPDEILAKRILMSDVVYQLDFASSQGTVHQKYWYEMNR